MSELSQNIAVPLSTATRMVDWMVENEYAKRLPDSTDRRIVRVALTDKGHNLSKEAKRHLFEHAAEFLRRLPEVQRKTLLINAKEVVRAWAAVMENSA